MFHSDTQHLIDLWTGLAGAKGVRAGAPSRRDVLPEALGPRLARTFLIDRDGRLRLTGGWIEALHDRRLTGANWLDAWSQASRPRAADALTQTLREARPVVATTAIAADAAPIEIVLAPLRDEAGGVDLAIGLYAPGGPLTLAVDAPRLLEMRRLAPVGEPARAALSLAALDGRRIA